MEKWICKPTGLECIKCNIGCENRKIINVSDGMTKSTCNISYDDKYGVLCVNKVM